MSSSNKKYIKSFDALRVIALLGVFLYHLMPNYVPSGYLGVVIFFVLAGFLTMKQAMDGSQSLPIQRDDRMPATAGVLKIRDKILKLYPALLFTIIIVTVCMCYYFRNFLVQYPVDAVSSALSFNNYAQILRNESYFEAMNSIKPLTHIWALSLEFQFYVLFFLLVFPFYKKENKNKFLIGFFILTILSIALAIHLVLNGANLTRIYYSIDSRIATFLIGMIGALVADEFSEYMVKVPAFTKLLEAILIFIMLYAMLVSFSTDQEVIGIIIVYSLMCGGLVLLLYCDDKLKGIAELVHTRDGWKVSSPAWGDKMSSPIRTLQAFATTIVSEIVKRSYIIYLVHYPIIIFSNRFLAHANIDLRLYFLITILVVIVVSDFVYWIIQVLFFSHKDKKLEIVLIVSMFLIVMSSAMVIKYTTGSAPKSDDLNDTTWLTNTTENEILKHFSDDVEEDPLKKLTDNFNKMVIASESETSDINLPVDGIYDDDGNLLASKEELNTYQIQTVFSRMNKVNNLIGGDATLTREEFLKYRNMKISFIGDSVTQGSRGSLSVYFPNSVINAEGNRQLRKALPIFYEMKEKGELGDVVVVALGTNSDNEIRTDVLEEIYENLDNRMMIILTVAIPYVVMEQQRNLAIRKFADTHDNCHLADWHGAMKTHKEYFIGDDTHPQGLGTDVYAQLIFKTAIESLEWRKIGNEWQYFGNGDKMKYSVEIEKNVGDTVEFGSYYINSSEEKSPIEWIVVDKNEELKTELLISKYALDRKKYNDVYANTTWQKSDIRRWLNNEFYSRAFENVGAKFIMSSPLYNHKNPEYKTSEANLTYDKVFLISYDELKKYLNKDYLKCKGTEYFKSIGGYVNEEGYADWWTRTAGDADNHMMNVSSDGEIIMKGDYVSTDDFGIRPMIKVSYK